MGNEINSKDFFKKVKEKIIADTNIENYNLVKETIDEKNLNDYFKDCIDTKTIIPILQKVNEYFLKNCEIYIDNLTIYPIETEIYFVNDRFHDGMCHMNELQKGFIEDENGEKKERFGKLYFHRIKDKYIQCKIKWGQRKKDPIDFKRGGVDVCLSCDENYYLSILIRSAFINGKLFSGINNICREIINVFEPKGCLQCFFNKLENIKYLVIKEMDKNIDSNIFKQPRIVGKKTHEGTKTYELNCLNLGKYLSDENNYEYLKKIKISYSIYTQTKKQEIIKEYQEYQKRLQTKNY